MSTRTRGARAVDARSRARARASSRAPPRCSSWASSPLYFLIPIWWLFVASTKSRGDLTTHQRAVVRRLQLLRQHRRTARLPRRRLPALDAQQHRSTPASAPCSRTVLAAMCGYALAKYRFPGREVIFNVVLGGVLVPATALALPLFLLFSQVQPDQHLLGGASCRASSARSVSTSARIYATASVPDELLEAGRHRRRRRGAHLLHGVDAADVPGPRHDLPVPVRRRSGTTSSCR